MTCELTARNDVSLNESTDLIVLVNAMLWSEGFTAYLMRMYLFIADDGGIAMFSYTQDRKHYLIYQLLNESYHFQTSMIPILTHFNIFFINHKKTMPRMP